MQYPTMIVPIIYIVSIMDSLTFSLVISSQNIYVKSLDGSQLYLGVLGSVCAAITLFLNPVVGSLSDSLGRKRVLLQSLLFNLIGNLLNVFITDLNLFLISRMIATFGSQLVPVLKTLIDDNIKDNDKKMGIMQNIQAIGGFSFILGALISGYLSEYDNGFKILYGLISVMLIISMVSISFIKDTTTRKEKPQSALAELKKIPNSLKSIDWPNYWDLFAIKLLADFTLSCFFFSLIPDLMTKYSLTGKHIGYVMASLGITGIAMSLSMKKVNKYLYSSDTTGFQPLFHACLLLGYSCVGRSLVSSLPLYILHIIPVSLTRNITEITFTELILKRAGPNEKGSVMGAFETTFSLSGLTAPLICGFMAHTLGDDMAIFLSAVPALLGAAVAYTQKNKLKTK